MNTVWVLGDAVVDLLPDGEHRYLRCPGGAPANVAVAISRLSGKSAFIGRVGNDPLGRFLRQTLQQEGVAIDHMYLDPIHRTSTVIVDLDLHGERTFTFMVNPSADQFLEIDDLPKFEKNQWLHFCSIALINQPSRTTVQHAVTQIKQAGGFVSFDPNLRPSLWLNENVMIEEVNKMVAMADVIKFSEEEICLLSHNPDLEQAIIQTRQQYPDKLILVTLGADGALYFYQQISGKIAGNKVNVVDTTGAGDAFVGGMLQGLAQHPHWQQETVLAQSIQQANLCGGLATTAKGAMSALPTRQQVAQLTQ
ncbi:fructokinase [Gallibacterium salpingitidis]|uniref:Fructokinase n=1 Tax=Gallibacterium salpingitidis TaxID=505341 RepID=A0AB36E398_9PAST|nr:aminoimidazole riboside kinase [Gallibacterium salpingitidis]OBX09092.1 fructokinase [Gallibacterium salpingitidis]OBX10905.1 fructokinase [Gallibacterium salpingitidis]WKS99721.1 aminoimidazole riboside kinase [Gallibacterium salpingitidis]